MGSYASILSNRWRRSWGINFLFFRIIMNYTWISDGILWRQRMPAVCHAGVFYSTCMESPGISVRAENVQLLKASECLEQWSVTCGPRTRIECSGTPRTTTVHQGLPRTTTDHSTWYFTEANQSFQTSSHVTYRLRSTDYLNWSHLLFSLLISRQFLPIIVSW